MILRVLKRTFWVFYDNLLKGMIINFFTFLVLIVLMLICNLLVPKEFSVVASVIAATAAWYVGGLGIMNFWIKEIKGQDNKGAFREIMAGIAGYWPQALALFGINMLFSALAFFSVNFYLQNKNAMAAQVMAGLGLFLIFVFLVMQVYLMPIVALDEKKRVLTSYKKAFIMSFSSPVSSPLVMIFIASLLFPIVLFIFGLPLNILNGLPMIFLTLMPFVSFVIIILLQLNSTFLTYERFKIFDQDLKTVWEDKALSNLFKPWEPPK